MREEAKIKVGVPYSTSRKMEKAMKRKTDKKRRQLDRKLTQGE
jgi:hypothetical protein